MAIFSWEGKNSTGQVVTGEVEAKDLQAVFNILRSQQIVPNAKNIKEKGKGFNTEIKIPGFQAKVTGRDVVIFTRQLATMIDSGLPLVQALQILASSSDKKHVQKVLNEVRGSIETGTTLADGLKKFPNTFDDLYVNMIKAGEDGGILDVILDRLSGQIEKSMKLKREIKTAMIYPIVVVSAAAIVTSVLLIFVIPTFADLFEGFGQALPLPTQIVIALSNFFVSNWYLIFGGIGLGIGLLIKFMKTDRGKEVIHPIVLKLPIFGDIIRKVAVARFTRTLGTMISSGVPILDALLICSRTAGNKVVEKEVQMTRVSISEGKSICEPLKESSIFPPMVTSMIGVGETTGALDAMLNKIAEFYEDEVDTAVTGMKQLIEPLMILFLGVVIGGLVISMYLPIFKMGAIVG